MALWSRRRMPGRRSQTTMQHRFYRHGRLPSIALGWRLGDVRAASLPTWMARLWEMQSLSWELRRAVVIGLA